MTPVQIVPATEIAFSDFTALLNAAYQDYYVPLDMSVRQLRERVARDDIDMTASQVALLAGEPVGMGMLALRGQRAWIGGVGVLPSHRGHGIGRGVMEALLGAGRDGGAQHVQLEVIRQNTAARALYDSLGFRQARVLHVAEGFARARVPGYKFQQVSVTDALRFFERFRAAPNPWQRERVALERLAPNLSAWVAIEQDTIQAYALGVFRVDVIRYVDVACAPGQGRALRALVGELHRQNPLAAGSIINIAEDDPAWAVLFTLGYKPYLSQFEMTLAL